jgi:hypothetical protein
MRLSSKDQDAIAKLYTESYSMPRHMEWKDEDGSWVASEEDGQVTVAFKNNYEIFGVGNDLKSATKQAKESLNFVNRRERIDAFRSGGGYEGAFDDEIEDHLNNR